MTGDAGFSACGQYRWWLRRQWQPLWPRLLVIGLNPSRADAQRDDPTLRRIVGFAQRWGYGSVTLLNLHARITPNPAVLRRCPDPVGSENDRWLRTVLTTGGVAAWLAWGNQGSWRGRDRAVLDLLGEAAPGVPLLVLGLTAQGQPRHPLYAPATLPPQRVCRRRLLQGSLAQTSEPGASCGQRVDEPWPAPRVATPSICI